jgi:LacI family transcriptional regulator
MSNIYDVARLAGVSPSTVSRVLNNNPKVSQSTYGVVSSAMKSLGYRPSKLARGLALKKTEIVGLIISNLRHRWAANIVEGLEHVASSKGYQVIVCNGSDDPVKERMLVESLISQNIDGVVLMSGPNGKLSPDTSHLVYESGIPCVVIWQAAEKLVSDSVIIDFREGHYLLTKHLIELGHKRICVAAGSPSYYTTHLHLDGYKKAVEEFNLSNSFSRIFYAGGSTSSPEIGYQMADAIASLYPRPTAIQAVNDVTAIAIIQKLNELGIKVPEEISVTGFDDIDLASYCQVPLTTANVPTKELAIEAANQLFSRLDGTSTSNPQHLLLKPGLIIRKSTTKPID